MNDNFIGIKEMAERLDVPVSWLYQRTRTNEIPHYKLGKYVKFSPKEIMEFIKSQNEKD